MLARHRRDLAADARGSLAGEHLVHGRERLEVILGAQAGEDDEGQVVLDVFGGIRFHGWARELPVHEDGGVREPPAASRRGRAGGTAAASGNGGARRVQAGGRGGIQALRAAVVTIARVQVQRPAASGLQGARPSEAAIHAPTEPPSHCSGSASAPVELRTTLDPSALYTRPRSLAALSPHPSPAAAKNTPGLPPEFALADAAPRARPRHPSADFVLGLARTAAAAMAGSQQQQIIDTIFSMKRRLLRKDDCT